MKDFLLRISKRLVNKAGYTVFRGDIRQSIRENIKVIEPPAHLMQHTRVCANRYEALPLLPRGGTVVEVGVAYGDFTRSLLDILQPDAFIAIDSFGIVPETEPWGRTVLREQGVSHYDYYAGQFRSYVEAGKMTIKKGLSWEMLAELPDNSVDYMYIDADHSYQAVAREARALAPKMKENGIVTFNDYTYFNYNTMEGYGVPAVVHEFMREQHYEMLYLCLHPQGFYDVVLRRMS